MSSLASNIAASGLVSQSQALAITANNLANTITTGFKSSRAAFADLLYQALTQPGIGQPPTGVGVSYGTGTAVAASQILFSQGPLITTGRPLDVAINGRGFFTVSGSQGEAFYTRAGNFTQDAQGRLALVSANGAYLLQPEITIPAGAENLSIGPDGTVSATVAGATTPLGRIQAAGFINPDGLAQVGDNLFAETGASGGPDPGTFGQNGFGSLQQGFLEGSNVAIVDEIVQLITTQRDFGLSAEVFRAANQNIVTLLASIR